MGDFELVDYTISSPFEQFVQAIQSCFEALQRSDPNAKVVEKIHNSCFGNTKVLLVVNPRFHFHLLKKLNTKVLLLIKPLTNCDIKLLSSAAHIALQSLSVFVPYIVEDASLAGQGAYYLEGIALNHKRNVKQAITVQRMPFVPLSCLELKGLATLFVASRRNLHSDIEAICRFSYTFYPDLNSWADDLNLDGDSNWIIQSVGGHPNSLALSLLVEFPKEPIAYFYKLSKIDPFSSKKWFLSLTFKESVLHPTATTLNLIRTQVKNSDSTGSYDTNLLPGAFESTSSNKCYIDSRDVEQSMLFIFSPSNVSERKVNCATIEQLVSSLRSQGTTCPRGSLVWNVCKRIYFCSLPKFKVPVLPHLSAIWDQFIRKIRNYTECGQLIPNIELVTSIPLNHCLVYQKLCMINYCISKKFAAKNIEKPDKGRKNISSDLVLDSGQPIYVPLTQEAPLMTSDMLFEQQHIFEKLGTSAEGQKIRSKMQSAQLQSDIQAFKAANPNALFHDFVKWHSPRDWIDGALSRRFQAEDNIWKTLFEEASAASIFQQKPLFDIEKEMALALHYLENLSLSELASHLWPVFTLIAYDSLLNQPSYIYRVPCVINAIDSVAKSLQVTSELQFDSLLSQLRLAEERIVFSKLVQEWFPGNSLDILNNLIDTEHLHQVQPDEKVVVSKLFCGKNGLFPSPARKEYTLNFLDDDCNWMNFATLDQGFRIVSAFGETKDDAGFKEYP